MAINQWTRGKELSDKTGGANDSDHDCLLAKDLITVDTNEMYFIVWITGIDSTLQRECGHWLIFLVKGCDYCEKLSEHSADMRLIVSHASNCSDSHAVELQLLTLVALAKLSSGRQHMCKFWLSCYQVLANHEWMYWKTGDRTAPCFTQFGSC